MPVSATLLAIGTLLVLAKPTRFAGLLILTLLALTHQMIFFVALAVLAVAYFLFR